MKASRFHFRLWCPDSGEGEDFIPAHMDYNPSAASSITRTWETKNHGRWDTTAVAKVRVNDIFKYQWEGAVWMQSTGLKDKNGKEIFEGDFVDFGPGYGVEVVDDLVEGNFIYISYHEMGGRYIKENGVVIGNKYEHPHLLK